jgi:PhzF family phenazine biosynthesis protein
LKKYPFKQVDAFTSRPLFGNPVAIVLGADDLDSDQMQRIANWTNLSETTFVLESTTAGPAYRLRIFTPTSELPFAGHPTIGSCHAVLEAGIVSPTDGRMTQECGAGNLPLRIDGEGPDRMIWVEAPEAKLMGGYPDLAPALSDALRSHIADSPPPTAFRNGPTWLFVRFDEEEGVAALKPDMSALAKLTNENGVSGVATFAFTSAHPEEPASAHSAAKGVSKEQFAVRIRCFAPAHNIPEDPVTGSANAALPAYLAHHGLRDRTGREYTATQGTELGRDGRVSVRILDDSGRSEIGGRAVTLIDGEIRA